MIANANSIAAGTATTAALAENNSRVDKDAFLELLVAQLKNQDPLDPASNEEFMGQLAQLEQLENSQNLNKGFEEMATQLGNLLGQQSMLSASNLLGSQVKSSGVNGVTTGIVEKVSVIDGEVKLFVDGYTTSVDAEGLSSEVDVETTLDMDDLTEVTFPEYDLSLIHI